MQVTTICGSKKSIAGRMGRPSAARTILGITEEGIRRAGGEPDPIDFSHIDLPSFEGVALTSYEEPALSSICDKLSRHGALILSAPAYWGGPSGLVKNFIDLLGGAAYAHGDGDSHLIAGKRIALIVVGAARDDSARAAAQLQYSFERMGARMARSRLCLDDPGQHDPGKIAVAALTFARSFMKELQDEE